MIVIVCETRLSDATWEDEMDTLVKELDENASRRDGTNNLEIFKNVVNNLHGHIAVLTDDIKFLREDPINKSNIIKRLLSIINGSQNKVSLNNDKSLDGFNDSTYNDHADVYYDNISNYNNVIDGPDIGGMQSTMINAHNKCIHDNFQANDLRVTSLLDTTTEERRC